MRDETFTDKLWSGILIALPVLSLIFGLIPGSMSVYDSGKECFVSCNLLSTPASSIMSNLCPVLLLLIAYLLVLTICYWRSQALGTIKAIFIFSVVVLVFSIMALLPENVVKPMPYGITVILWGIMSVVSFIRMKKEIKRYDFD